MQELRALEVLDVFQRGDQRLQVMAVDGADVVEAEILEKLDEISTRLSQLEKARDLKKG